MKFYASMTVSPSTIDAFRERILAEYGTLDPLGPVIYTPISTGDGLTEEMELLSEDGVEVMFDSGGYHVQTNNGNFDELYNYIMPFYDENRWGNKYTLPDNVPLSDDNDETVDQKVNETRTNAKLSYHFLPDELKSRAVPVIQGSKYRHITDCIDTYTELDQIQTVGFGSFETFGKNNGVNIISERVAETLQYAVNLAHNNGLEIHAFGVGGPTAIPVLGKLGVDTFDCSSWLRAAGYGDIYFPFRTPRNVTHQTDRSGPKVFDDNLERLKKETNHSCPFCESYYELRDSRMTRILHNLMVLRDMAESIENYSTDEMVNLMNDNSRYTSILRSIS